MKTDLIHNEDLTADIKITIEPEDYKSQFDSELKKLQSTTNMRGFRKGKTPRSFLMKRFGESVLYDIVNKKIQEGLRDALENVESKVLGNPMIDESQKAVTLEPGTEKDYTFHFQVGILPEFEIKGLTEPFLYYDVVIDEKTIDENLDQMRQQDGTRKDVEGDFEGKDLITFNAREMEGKEIRTNGLETTFQILIDDIPDEEIREKILTAKVGDKVVFDIYKISENSDESFVRKYLMNLEEEDESLEVNPVFEGEVVEAKRYVPAEMTEEFFEKYFGEEVTTEEAAREKIEEYLKNQYDAQANRMLNDDVYDRVMKETEIRLPDEFMKRWFMEDAQAREHEISQEELDEEYEKGLRDSLRWQVISERWQKEYEIKAESEEIIRRIQDEVFRYLPPQSQAPEMVKNIIRNIASDEEQVSRYRTEVLAEKMFARVREELTLDKKPVSVEDFLEIGRKKEKEMRKKVEAHSEEE